MRILIVDDAEDLLLVIATILESWGYETITCTDGAEAWALIQRGDIAFVISDWLMPGLDGVELCRRVRAVDVGHYVYFILLTGLESKASLVEGMDAGADDFLVKPVAAAELRVRIRAGERVLALEQQLAEHNRKLSETFDTLRQDLETAAVLQKTLLPKPQTLQNTCFTWLFLPSAFVAGDTFDYFPLDQNHIGFYQLDVAGHGIPSALLSFTLNRMLARDMSDSGFLKRRLREAPYYAIESPPGVLRELNRRFAAEGDTLLYFTMIYAVLDTLSGAVTLVQAGHPSPVWLQRATGEVITVGAGGLPVGILPDPGYDTVTFTLAPQDRLFLYSDGITDCASPGGELFASDRLLAVLRQSADQPLDAVVADLGRALHDWKGDEHYSDDITLLALEWLGPPGRA